MPLSWGDVHVLWQGWLRDVTGCRLGFFGWALWLRGGANRQEVMCGLVWVQMHEMGNRRHAWWSDGQTEGIKHEIRCDSKSTHTTVVSIQELGLTWRGLKYDRKSVYWGCIELNAACLCVALISMFWIPFFTFLIGISVLCIVKSNCWEHIHYLSYSNRQLCFQKSKMGTCAFNWNP